MTKPVCNIAMQKVKESRKLKFFKAGIAVEHAKFPVT